MGYFTKLKGTYFPIEFYFTHCFWYLVKYNTQKSCWESNKLPMEEYYLDILEYHIVDRSKWGPIDRDKLTTVMLKTTRARDNTKVLTSKYPQKKKKELKDS